MKDILDAADIEQPNNRYYWTVILTHVMAVLMYFVLVFIFRNNVSELIIKVLEVDIHLLGLFIFIVFTINTIIIANRLNRAQDHFSNYKIAFAGGVSLFIGKLLYSGIMTLFFAFKGVAYGEAVPLLVYSVGLFIFGFFITLIRIKKLRGQKRILEWGLFILLWLGVGFLISA